MPVPVVDPITILDNPYGMELILKSQLLRLKLQKDSEKRGEHWKHPNPTVKSDLPSTEIIAQLIGFILATQNLYFLTTASSKNHHPTKADRFFAIKKTYFLKKKHHHFCHFPHSWFPKHTATREMLNLLGILNQPEPPCLRVFHQGVSLTTHEWKKDRLAKMDSFPKQKGSNKYHHVKPPPRYCISA